MAPSTVPTTSIPVTAAQTQLPTADDTRRSKSSAGPRDAGTAPPGSSTERTGTPSNESLEPDWAATTDAATD